MLNTHFFVSSTYVLAITFTQLTGVLNFDFFLYSGNELCYLLNLKDLSDGKQSK